MRSIDNLISNLKIKKGDNLVIHANISRLGIDNKKKILQLLDKINLKIGKSGSIVMPDYRLYFKTNKINFLKCCNKNNGVLSNIFKENYKVYRSKSLLHAHIGIGPKAKYLLTKSVQNKSFGHCSDFDLMTKDFKLILLGCEPNEGATYLHHMEVICKVPYRKWVKLNFKIKERKTNKVRVYNYNYYTRKEPIKENFNYFFNQIKNNLINIDNKYGKTTIIKLSKLHNLVKEKIRKNNFILVKR